MLYRRYADAAMSDARRERGVSNVFGTGWNGDSTFDVCTNKLNP